MEFEVSDFVEGGKPEPARMRTSNIFNPHVTLGLGVVPGPQQWEGSEIRYLTTWYGLYCTYSPKTVSEYRKLFISVIHYYLYTVLY